MIRSTFLKSVLFGLILVGLISCETKPAEPAQSVVIDVEQIKKEIQAKENEFADTYNAGVLKELGYYASDAISFSQNKEPLVGRNKIVAYLASDIDAFSQSNQISFETIEVHVSNDGNQVVEVGHYIVVDSTNVPVNTGNYMSLFVKRDGQYVCLRDISASDMELE
ncbi:MAG: nuclear transport factor 2 family protein [Lutimonas sp.]